MTRTPTPTPTPRALLSVSDKTGVTDLARTLLARGFELVSTGGTFAHLRSAGLPVTAVSDLTGFPEMLGGRVKTLHPAIHGGILARREDGHLAELAAQGLAPIDVVCVNLYPFRETVAQGASFEEAVEQIDIGGPAMLRAAAKNHADVLILVDPHDYSLAAGDVDPAGRRRLAAKAFAHVSGYDAAVAAYLEADGEDAPDTLTLGLQLAHTVRYGENPHQHGAVYRTGSGPLLDARQLSGKAMSYNNFADADAAWALAAELAQAGAQPACVAVKHGNPCGVARGDSAAHAWERARDADALSVFGGVVAMTHPLDLAAAQALMGTFLEVLVVPGADEDAAALLARRKPDLRLLVAGPPSQERWEYRSVAGGLLRQERDTRVWDDLCPERVCGAEPGEAALRDARLAWHVVKHTRSNAVALVKDGVTVGLGGGAVSRIWALERALANAGAVAQGAVLASEAFFPFPDTVQAAAAAGVGLIVQPGGAKRDPEVVAEAERLGLTMLFTGSRHFKH